MHVHLPAYCNHWLLPAQELATPSKGWSSIWAATCHKVRARMRVGGHACYIHCRCGSTKRDSIHARLRFNFRLDAYLCLACGLDG